MQKHLFSLLFIAASFHFNAQTLNFDQPFGTTSWSEDGYSWSWDNSGWDNIRTYAPHSGTGHAMSAPGYHSKLSSTTNINIQGLWLKTDFASNFNHLNLKGYDNTGNVIYNQSLNPSNYQQYSYVTLNWVNLKSFAVDYDGVPRQNTLNFDEPFGTQSWSEDGISWSWDNSGWDNIRTYAPHTGTGHGMSAPGYHSKLSANTELTIHGVWLKTDNASNFSHLNLKGYDSSGNLLNTQALNPADYQQYKYVALNWNNVKSFSVDYNSINQGTPIDLYYDDLVYSSPYDLESVDLYYDEMDYSISSLGLSDNQPQLNIHLYPNPAQNFIQVTGLTSAQEYHIYAVSGEMISNGIVHNNDKIDIHNLKNGVYFIKIDAKKAFKFIKN